MMDFTTIKESTIKTTARTEAVEALKEMLTERFGDGNVTQVGSGEFSVALGIAPNGNEVCVNFSITAKEFADRQTAKRSYTAYDRLAEGETFEEKLTESAEKKVAAAEKKQAKIEADKKARAKAKEAKETIEFDDSDAPF